MRRGEREKPDFLGRELCDHLGDRRKAKKPKTTQPKRKKKKEQVPKEKRGGPAVERNRFRWGGV